MPEPCSCPLEARSFYAFTATAGVPLDKAAWPDLNLFVIRTKYCSKLGFDTIRRLQVTPGGKSGPILAAVSAFFVLANIKPFPANCNFTPGSSFAFARRPYIMIVPVQSTAVRAQAKGATWKAVRDEIFSEVRG